MVTKIRSAAKNKSVATETSKSIEEQTEAFLKAGGKIEYVNSGVSGVQSVAARSRHITLGSKSTKA